MPITKGTTTADRPPAKLKTPPIKPTKRFGVKSETNTHVIDANHYQKMQWLEKE